MNVRCSYCRQSFNLSRDYLVQALAEAQEKRQKYHAVECINCRKMIKVPVSQMKRFVPQPAEEDAG
ncbi:MAG: hypothetical protein H6666_08320 [Ardenticatenaceae bacterium]|nr:hypothetical protein [Anaerolineales bacterium]MCB8917916.1 hypothetical protein [Ardenticatenaceae bacterium]